MKSSVVTTPAVPRPTQVQYMLPEWEAWSAAAAAAPGSASGSSTARAAAAASAPPPLLPGLPLLGVPASCCWLRGMLVRARLGEGVWGSAPGARGLQRRWRRRRCQSGAPGSTQPPVPHPSEPCVVRLT